MSIKKVIKFPNGKVLEVRDFMEMKFGESLRLEKLQQKLMGVEENSAPLQTHLDFFKSLLPGMVEEDLYDLELSEVGKLLARVWNIANGADKETDGVDQPSEVTPEGKE